MTVPEEAVQVEVALRALALGVAFTLQEHGVRTNAYSNDGGEISLSKWPDARHHLRQYIADKHGISLPANDGSFEEELENDAQLESKAASGNTDGTITHMRYDILKNIISMFEVGDFHKLATKIPLILSANPEPDSEDLVTDAVSTHVGFAAALRLLQKHLKIKLNCSCCRLRLRKAAWRRQSPRLCLRSQIWSTNKLISNWFSWRYL